MAVEIIGKATDVRRYREYLHNQGILTKRFMTAVGKGASLAKKPEGYRIFNGGIKSVYNVDKRGGIDNRVKGFNEEERLFIAGIANANATDRMDERLEPAGINIENFMKNRVLLLDHLYVTSATIGRVVDIKAEHDGVHFEAFIGDPTKARLTQEQITTRSLVAQGLLQTVSVGFIPHKVKAPEFGTEGQLVEPAVIMEWELLELSIVAVPANAGAVFEAKDVSFNDAKKSKPFYLTSKANEDTIAEDESGVSSAVVDNITLAEEEKIMEEKLVEMIEEMKRNGSVMSTVAESMSRLVDQNEAIMSKLDSLEIVENEEEAGEEEPMEEKPEGAEMPKDDEEDEEDEEEDEDKKALSDTIAEMKEMSVAQDEKIEQLSQLMLRLFEQTNGDTSNNG